MKKPKPKDRICRTGKETRLRLIYFKERYGYDNEVENIQDMLLDLYPLNKICIHGLYELKGEKEKYKLKSTKEYKRELIKKVDNIIKGIDERIFIDIDLNEKFKTPNVDYKITKGYRLLYEACEDFYKKLNTDERKDFQSILKLIEKMIYQSYRICNKLKRENWM